MNQEFSYSGFGHIEATFMPQIPLESGLFNSKAEAQKKDID